MKLIHGQYSPQLRQKNSISSDAPMATEGNPLSGATPHENERRRIFEETSATGVSKDAGGIFSGLLLKDYQTAYLLRFNKKWGFKDRTVLEVGADFCLATAEGMLRLGAKKVYAVNPNFPENLASPDKRIVPIKRLGEDTRLPDGCADIIFGVALLEHVHNVPLLAVECKRILNERGVCWLQGNPIWTSARGHHTWLKNLSESGNSYFSHLNSPWKDWEHLCVKNYRDGESRLLQRGVPACDIAHIVNQLLDNDHISRKTPSDIEKSFRNFLNDQCYVFRRFSGWNQNEYYNEVRDIYGDEDLQCDEMQIMFGNIEDSPSVL